MKKTSGTENSRLIHAAAHRIYTALTDPKALETWQAPGDMTGKVHRFDLREGGGYEMSLYYPETETESPGKTAAREDRFTVRFLKLEPPHKIIQTVNFDTSDPDFAGEMTMTITLEPQGTGTRVTYRFDNIPPGIRPEDNEEGTRSSLEKLAIFVEKG